jgi:hypothetical protein
MLEFDMLLFSKWFGRKVDEMGVDVLVEFDRKGTEV